MLNDRSTPAEAGDTLRAPGISFLSKLTSLNINPALFQRTKPARRRRFRGINLASLAASLLSLLSPLSVALALFTNGGFEAGDFSS